MKSLLIALTIAFSIGLTCCDKDSNSKSDEKKITFLKTISGGCHNEVFSDLKSSTEDCIDTVIFTIINKDTLNAFVGLNYICCAPFITETIINNDTLTMEISDTCSSTYETCYCRCDCYYTWDFQFVDFEKKEYYYIVKINDPREENTIIFKQGKIDLSK